LEMGSHEISGSVVALRAGFARMWKGHKSWASPGVSIFSQAPIKEWHEPYQVNYGGIGHPKWWAQALQIIMIIKISTQPYGWLWQWEIHLDIKPVERLCPGPSSQIRWNVVNLRVKSVRRLNPRNLRSSSGQKSLLCIVMWKLL
jgi:hypothetical protein